eukprot:scpid88015/ scgid20632/ 
MTASLFLVLVVAFLLFFHACLGQISTIKRENFFQWPNGAIIDVRASSSRHASEGGEPAAARKARVYSPDGKLIAEQEIGVVDGEVHTVRRDAEARKDGETDPEYYSGWVEYSGYEARSNVTHMSARFTVPPAPPSYNILTTMFLFAGLEANNGHKNATDILQPVLQYGHSGCGGGEHWSAASYYVVGIRAHCGSTLRVKTGDVLEANMTYNVSEDMWTLTTTLVSSARSWYDDRTASGNVGALPQQQHEQQHASVSASVLRVRVDHAYHWAMVTLEAIRVYSCRTYPSGNGTRFSDMTVHVDGVLVASPAWAKTIHYTECGQSVDIIDSRTSILHYSAESTP